jgi:large subunit ribosomal protein L9
MSKIDVILKENIKGLGVKNDVVTVSDGYATNYLFARSLAVPYNTSNKKDLNKQKSDIALKESRILEIALQKKKSIDGKVIEISKKANANKLFGAVSHKDIFEAIHAQLSIDIDRKKILSKEIKDLGDHMVDIKLHSEVVAKLIVRVKAI